MNTCLKNLITLSLILFAFSFSNQNYIYSASIPIEPNFKVAFIGDSGDGEGHRLIMQLIANEGVDLVIHSGDFSYESGPTTAWTNNITQSIGNKIPYLGSDGNHDDWAEYVPFFQSQITNNGLKVLEGTVSSGNYAIDYKGLYMAFTKEKGDANFVKTILAKSTNIWKVCSEHQNRKDFQAGGKGDEASLSFFEECLKGGAIIVNGHEHSYARTLTMSDLSSTGPSKGYSPVGAGTRMDVVGGAQYKGFILVNGASGVSLRNYSTAHDSNYWWSTIYAGGRYCKNNCTDLSAKKQNRANDIKDVPYKHVSAFIEFAPNGNQSIANGYTKNVENCVWGDKTPCGRIIDEFTIHVNAGGIVPTTVPSPNPTITTTPKITPTPRVINYDINKDGKVNILDILVLLAEIF